MTTYDEYIYRSQVLLYQQEDDADEGERKRTRQLALEYHLDMMTKLGLVFKHTVQGQYLGFTISLGQLRGSSVTRDYLRVSRVDSKCTLFRNLTIGDELIAVDDALIVDPGTTFAEILRSIYGSRRTLTFIKGIPADTPVATTFVPASPSFAEHPEEYGIHDIHDKKRKKGGLRRIKSDHKVNKQQQQQVFIRHRFPTGGGAENDDEATEPSKQEPPQSQDVQAEVQAAAQAETAREALRRVLAHHVREMDAAGLVVRHTFTEDALGFVLALESQTGRDALVVSETEPRCPLYPERLRPGDELIAVNDGLVVNPTEKNFKQLVDSILKAPRPLHCTFIEGVQRDLRFKVQQATQPGPLPRKSVSGAVYSMLFGQEDDTKPQPQPQPPSRDDSFSLMFCGTAGHDATYAETVGDFANYVDADDYDGNLNFVLSDDSEHQKQPNRNVTLEFICHSPTNSDKDKGAADETNIPSC